MNQTGKLQDSRENKRQRQRLLERNTPCKLTTCHVHVQYKKLSCRRETAVVHWNYVSRIVSEIFSVKEWRDLEIGDRSRSRSLEMAPFDRPYTTFYWSAIVYIALSGTVFELFDVEYYRDLEIWVRGHWRSFKLVPFENLDAVSYSPSYWPYL